MKKFVALALVTCALACSGPHGPSAPVAASASVGPAGGQVSLDGGPSLSVPGGALRSTVLLSIKRSSDAPPSGAAMTPLYEFAPSDITFDTPVVVSLAVPAGTADATIYWKSAGASAFEALATTISGNVATASVHRLGVGFVGAACHEGESCTPAAECHVGTISCTSGAPMCVDSGTAAPDGVSCSSYRVCRAGACGGAWTWMPVPLASEASITDVWGSGPHDVWVVGYGARFRHWDGAQWSFVPVAADGVTITSSPCVWGSAPDDVWFVGYRYAPTAQTCIVRWTGAGGTSSCLDVFVGAHRLWGTSASDVWLVGDVSYSQNEGGGFQRTVYHWDGASWTNVPTGLPRNGGFLLGIWGSGPSDVWIVGSGSTILHWDGHAFATVPSNTPADLRSVWGLSPRDVWAGGDNVLLHWDGQSWKPASLDFLTVPNPPPWPMPAPEFGAMWGIGSDVFMFGAGHLAFTPGTSPLDGVGYVDAFRWSDGAWHRTAATDHSGLPNAIWGSGPADVWAVGPAGFLHYP